MENNKNNPEEQKTAIVKSDRENEQESFINDQVKKDHDHKPAQDIKKDSEELADKRSTKISDTPDNENDDTDLINSDGDEPEEDESEETKPKHNHL
jgi:hypothetical protein